MLGLAISGLFIAWSLSACAARPVTPVPGSSDTIGWSGGSQQPMIPVTIGGHPTDALIDAGFAGNLIIPVGRVAALGLATGAAYTTATNALGGTTVFSIPEATLAVGGVRERISPVDAGEFPRVVDLGLAWLERRGAILDCARRLVTWPPAGGPTPPDYRAPALQARGYVRVPLSVCQRTLMLPVSIDGRAARFLLDTGSATSFLDAPLASAWGLALVDPPRTRLVAKGSGLSPKELGRTRRLHLMIGGLDHPIWLDTFDLGPLNQARAAAFPSPPDAPCDSFQGIVGMDLLMEDGAIIDFGSKSLSIAPR